MRRLAILVLVLALAPVAAVAKPVVFRPRDIVDSEALATAAATKLGTAIRARDVAQISSVLGARFTNNGMWFPDAACAKRFAPSGEVKGGDVAVFARCLAGLSLQVSTRKAAQRDEAVLTADPGVEIELAFQGEALRWIGLPTQGGADRALPMLTAQALEALRVRGATVVDTKVARALDLERANQGAAMATAWLKVCLDPEGEITKLVALQASSPAAAEAFLAAAADWKFKPFVVRGQGVAACSASLLVYPASKAPLVEQYPSSIAPAGTITRTYEYEEDDFELIGGVIGGVSGLGAPPPPPPPPPPDAVRNVSPTLVEKLRVAGNKVIVPDAPTVASMQRGTQRKIVASAKMCLDDKGNVYAVSTLASSGYPAYDRKIVSEMQQWVFNAYRQNGRAIAVCTAVTFIYAVPKP